MRRFLCIALFSIGLTATRTADAAKAKHYVCPPCSLPCDSKVFEKPGTCPSCGMTLVDQDSVGPKVPHAKVAILIFDGVEIIDYTGPWEVFGAADFEVYTVAKTKAPITTAMGMTVIPQYTFADAPQPDVLVVPGGGVRRAQDDTTLKWIRDTSPRTRHTMSVCNGAFTLAKAGLLDGLGATTTASNLERLRAAYPKVRVIDNRRYVDNGRIITTGGLSAGIDGALHVVARMLGDGVAQQVALEEEYNWTDHSRFARGALADRMIPDLDLNTDLGAVGRWEVVRTEGGTDRWDMLIRGASTLSASELLTHIGKALESKGRWKSVPTGASLSKSSASSGWRFQGRDGKPWTGTLTVASLPGAGRRYTARLSIARAG